MLSVVTFQRIAHVYTKGKWREGDILVSFAVCKVWHLCNVEYCAVSAYALPMFREGRPTSTRKQEEKVRKDPVKSHRPDLPVYGPGESPDSQQHCTSIGRILCKVHSMTLSRSFHLVISLQSTSYPLCEGSPPDLSEFCSSKRFGSHQQYR